MLFILPPTSKILTGNYWERYKLKINRTSNAADEVLSAVLDGDVENNLLCSNEFYQKGGVFRGKNRIAFGIEPGYL